MGVVTVKDGVLFTKIAPGGFRLLEAISSTSRRLDMNLVITSACDGAHSGPNDPHHRGEAYDVRSHDMNPDQKAQVLLGFRDELEMSHFYCFLESPNTDNEHFHLQVAKGTVYP